MALRFNGPMQAVTYVYADRPADLARLRPEHRGFLRALHDAGRLRAAGPTPPSEGAPDGGLIIVEADTPAAALALLADDPFHRAGLITARSARPWTPVIGDWADRV